MENKTEENEKDLSVIALESPSLSSASGAGGGSLLEPSPIEKIDQFENLEAYTASEADLSSPPVPEALPPDVLFEVSPSPESAPDVELERKDNDAALLSDPVLMPPPVSTDLISAIVLDPLESIKKYSEKMTHELSTQKSLSDPFSLLITGHLLPHEKEKFLDFLSTEQVGIREIDLEPQWENGQFLIPQISEFAGILLAQLLRTAQVQIKLGPAETIFSAEKKRVPANSNPSSTVLDSLQIKFDQLHPAEDLPLTSDHAIAQIPDYQVIDTMTASALLKARSLDLESSTDYQEMIESLQRELKYKAYQRGADAILHFQIQTYSLNTPLHYRLLVSGTAIQAKKQ